MKSYLILIIAVFSMMMVGCAAPNYNYRGNPTYNYPPANGRTSGEAMEQREWARTESEFAKAENARAVAAMTWNRVESERVITGARAATEYSHAAEHASSAARGVADTIRILTNKSYWRHW